MDEYIEREQVKDELLSWAVCIKHPEHLLKEDALCVIDAIPAADVVSLPVVRQIQWERDIAMQQLKEHGIPFCGKADDVVPVVRCKDCKYCDPEKHHCDHPAGTTVYFPRKPDDFCSYGERRSDG